MERKLAYISFVILFVSITISMLIFMSIEMKKPKEGFTQLYFENFASLPKSIELNKTYNFSFTVKNFENKGVLYKYEIKREIFYENETMVNVTKTEKEFFLEDKKSKTVTETFNFSKQFEKSKFTISISISNKNKTKMQKINFWVFSSPKEGMRKNV